MTANPRDVLNRPAPAPDFTIRYGDHPDQVADVRLPPGDATRPLIIFIHGGFWQRRYDRAHTGPLAADLASRGYPVATIEYRRMGQDGGGWPGTFDDVAAAVRATPALIREQIEARGRIAPDLSRPILAGHSAGGHLALWVVRTGDQRGVVALAPIADLVLAHRLGLGDGATAALLGGGPARVPDRYAYADPAQLLPARCRVIIVHGTEDRQVPIEVSRSYAAAAQKAGDDTSLVELPGTEHYAVIDPRSPAWSTVLGALGAFVG